MTHAAADYGQSTRESGFARWAFALFVIDMMFLPMFHWGTIPFKPFYLLLPLTLPLALRTSVGRQLTWVCWLLGGVFVFGGLWLQAAHPRAGMGDTVRNSLIWILAPMAFGFGAKYGGRRLGSLAVLIPLYFALTALVTFSWRSMPGLMAFYGLTSWVESGLFEMRSPGLHFNPNLSALGMNLLLVGLVAGELTGSVRLRSSILRVLVFACVLGLHLLTASRGETLAALVIGVVWIYATVRQRRGGTARFVALSLAGSILVGAVLTTGLRHLAERNATFAFVQQQLTSSLSIGKRRDDPENPLNAILYRPLIQAERVSDRTLASPLWGSGYDITGTYPYDARYFHNDWAEVLVAGGAIGMVLFLVVVYFVGTASWVIALPFFLSSPVNSFVLAPQHVMLLFAITGAIAAAKGRTAVRSWTGSSPLLVPQSAP